MRLWNLAARMFGNVKRKDGARLRGRRDIDRPAMRDDQLAGDVQPKPDASRTIFPLLFTGPADHRIENLPQLARRDGCSLVAHRDGHL